MRQLVFALFILTVSIFSYASEQPLININAEGKVKAQPDMAVFSVTVQIAELNANKANQQVNSQVKDLLKSLTKFDIKDGSLDSSQASIQAEYDYSLKPKKLLGYRASRTVTFHLIDLGQLEALVINLSKLDYTNLNNIQYTLQDPRYFEDLALVNAIQIAKQKAKLIADEFGVDLGGFYKISHQVNQHQAPVHIRAMAMKTSLSESSSYEQKEMEISAFIEVSFQIN